MANPTTNFGWQMPTSTDLVTDLPADFEVFGQAVDTTLVDLKGGTTGQVLSKASNTDMDFTWIEQDDTTLSFNAQTGTTYQLALTDVDVLCSLVTFNNSSAISVTVPKNSTIAFNVGDTINTQQIGTGKVTFVPEDAGVTLNPSAILSISDRWMAVSLIQTAANVWSLIGSLST